MSQKWTPHLHHGAAIVERVATIGQPCQVRLQVVDALLALVFFGDGAGSPPTCATLESRLSWAALVGSTWLAVRQAPKALEIRPATRS